MRQILSLLATPILFVGAASAQNFNIDVGNPITGGNPLPSAAFGAAAGQPGTWNAVVRQTGGTPTSLVNVSGAATSVTMARTAGGGSDLFFDNVGTSGDDDALMDDAEYPLSGGTTTWTISGLAAGVYDVYTYAWAPDGAAYQSRVSVNGGPLVCVGGAWTGVYTTGVTHALDTVTISAGGSITISFGPTVCATFHTFNGVQIKSAGTTSTVFCAGNAPGTCLACGNNGAAGRGCANSGFASGTLLTNAGNASVGTDTLTLSTSDMTGPGLFFQADGLAASPVTFGDGMLCAAVGIKRLGVVFPTSGSATYPGGLTPNPITVGGGPILAGDTKHYQCWYRDALVFCSASTFNTSNGVTLTWGP